MLTVFSNINGFEVVELLPDNEKFNFEYYTIIILEKLKEKSSLDQRKGGRKLIMRCHIWTEKFFVFWKNTG